MSAQLERRLQAVDPEGGLVVAVFSEADIYGVDVIGLASDVMYEVRELPDVVDVRDPWTTGAQDLVNADRTGTTVTVEIDPTVDRDRALAAAERIDEPAPDAAGDYDGPDGQELVRRLRAADLGPDMLVGGPTAELVDTRDALADRARSPCSSSRS